MSDQWLYPAEQGSAPNAGMAMVPQHELMPHQMMAQFQMPMHISMAQQMMPQQMMPQMMPQQMMPQQMMQQQMMQQQMPMPMSQQPLLAQHHMMPMAQHFAYPFMQVPMQPLHQPGSNSLPPVVSAPQTSITTANDTPKVGEKEPPKIKAAKSLTVDCSSALESLQTMKKVEQEHQIEPEDLQSVKAFAESLKSSKRSSGKNFESSSDTDEEERERMRKKKSKNSYRKVKYIDDEDDDDEEEDESEDDEDMPSKKKCHTYQQKKGWKPASKGGRKKGSRNVQPRKDVIIAQLAAAQKKIKMLEKKEKEKAEAVRTLQINSAPSTSRFEYHDDSTGMISVIDHQTSTPMQGSNGAPPADLMTQYPEDHDVWKLPDDDYGELFPETPEEIPFAPKEPVLQTSVTAAGPSCKSCKLEPPRWMMTPCNHMGLCETCKDEFDFNVDRRCPGCGRKHFIVCQEVFL